MFSEADRSRRIPELRNRAPSFPVVARVLVRPPTLFISPTWTPHHPSRRLHRPNQTPPPFSSRRRVHPPERERESCPRRRGATVARRCSCGSRGGAQIRTGRGMASSPEAAAVGEEEKGKGKKEEGRRGGGVLGRMWRALFGGREDYEKRLQYLSKEEAAVHARMRRRTQFSRTAVRNLIVLSVLAEVRISKSPPLLYYSIRFPNETFRR